jgi:hypothetical protein
LRKRSQNQNQKKRKTYIFYDFLENKYIEKSQKGIETHAPTPQKQKNTSDKPEVHKK